MENVATEEFISRTEALETTPERLRELAAADKEGRVVVLPCKVGKKSTTSMGSTSSKSK